MEKGDVLIILLLIGTVFGSCYGTYRLGMYLERRSLTHYLVDAMDKACDECHDIGYTKAKSELNDNCDNVPMESGRY